MEEKNGKAAAQAWDIPLQAEVFPLAAHFCRFGQGAREKTAEQPREERFMLDLTSLVLTNCKQLP